MVFTQESFKIRYCKEKLIGMIFHVCKSKNKQWEIISLWFNNSCMEGLKICIWSYNHHDCHIYFQGNVTAIKIGWLGFIDYFLLPEDSDPDVLYIIVVVKRDAFLGSTSMHSYLSLPAYYWFIGSRLIMVQSSKQPHRLHLFSTAASQCRPLLVSGRATTPCLQGIYSCVSMDMILMIY